MEELNKFLLKHKTENNEEITHQSLPPQSGKYNIKSNELKIFHNLYYQAIKNGQKLYLIEKLPSISPIHIDLDFRFNQHYPNHKYNENHIKKFIGKYLEIIDNNLNITDDSDKMCLVYEIDKPVIEEKNNIIYKDGIHFIFPKIIADKDTQKILREEILEFFDDLFPKSEIEYTNDIDNIVDLSVIMSNGWLMYGSRKKDRDPYIMKRIYKENDNTLIQLNPNDMDLEKKIKFSSIRNKNDLTEQKDELIQKLSQNNIEEVENNYNNTLSKDTENIKHLLNCLLPFRYDEYKYWIELGFILYNISGGKNDYLGLWEEISKKSDKYIKNECKKHWKKMKIKTNYLGIGTLKMWAKQDNKKKYISIIFKEKELYDLIEDCFSSNHDYKIAKLIGFFYKNEFIYVNSDSKNSGWYVFRNHHWEWVGKENLKLSGIISDELPILFEKFKIQELEKIKLTNNLEEKTSLTKKYHNSYKNLNQKIENNSPKKRIIDEAKVFFSNKNFEKIRDMNTDLIGFTNGVYELSTHTFRNGNPDDNITLTVGYDKIPYDTIKDKDIYDDIEKFINTIFPNINPGDLDRREYVKKFLALSIKGLNTNEKLHIWSGEGGNGKTKLNELHNQTLGQYSGKLSSTYITNNRKNSSDASPDIINVRNCRFVTAQEPDSDAKINNGIFKEISGLDQMTARGLFSSPITFTPQFNFILMCNDIPNLQNPHDNGVFRRLVIIKFPVEFTNEVKEDDYVAKPDRSLMDKIPSWPPYYMNLLLEWNKNYFKTYKCIDCKINDATFGENINNDNSDDETDNNFVLINDNIEDKLKWCVNCAKNHNSIDLKYNRYEINIPEIIKNDTNDYKRGNDEWFPFFENYEIKNTGKQNDFIDIKELYTEFRLWCESDGNIKNKPTILEMRKYIIKCYLRSKDEKNFYDKNSKLRKWTITKI
jgi:phage/plasmid-associated DNA primase